MKEANQNLKDFNQRENRKNKIIELNMMLNFVEDQQEIKDIKKQIMNILRSDIPVQEEDNELSEDDKVDNITEKMLTPINSSEIRDYNITENWGRKFSLFVF